jgi:hypothetical protein
VKVAADLNVLQQKARRLEQALADAPAPDRAPQSLPEPATDSADAPPPSTPATDETPAYAGPTCSSCTHFAPVRIASPIVYPLGEKGRCLACPPSVPLRRHFLTADDESLATEMAFPIVDRDLPACASHPQYGRPLASVPAVGSEDSPNAHTV